MCNGSDNSLFRRLGADGWVFAGRVASLCGGMFMIYCCGKYFKPDYIIYPDDDREKGYIQQKLEVGYCPVHKRICELTYFNLNTCKLERVRPPAKKTLAFIEKFKKSQSVYENYKKIHSGSKSNQNWIYGLNVETKTSIKQLACDFNGTRRLLKEIILV